MFLFIFLPLVIFQSALIINILFLLGTAVGFLLVYMFARDFSPQEYTRETQSIRRKEAVRILSAIFGVFIALSLTSAAGNVLKDSWLLFTNPLSPTVVLFGVFLLTVVPFIQGSLI